MMLRGNATASPPTTTPKTIASSSYQSPSRALVSFGSSKAGMQPRGHGAVAPAGRASIGTPPQDTSRQSMSASRSAKNARQPGSIAVNSISFSAT